MQGKVLIDFIHYTLVCLVYGNQEIEWIDVTNFDKY